MVLADVAEHKYPLSPTCSCCAYFKALIYSQPVSSLWGLAVSNRFNLLEKHRWGFFMGIIRSARLQRQENLKFAEYAYKKLPHMNQTPSSTLKYLYYNPDSELLRAGSHLKVQVSLGQDRHEICFSCESHVSILPLQSFLFLEKPTAVLLRAQYIPSARHPIVE